MSLRFIFAAYMLLVIIVAIYIKPYIGILAFTALFYLVPQNYGLGIESLRSSLLVALVTLLFWSLSLLFNKEKKVELLQAPQSKLLIILFILMVISTINAVVSTEISIQRNIKFLKFIIFYVLIINLIRTQREFDILIWLNILCCVYFSIQGFQHRYDAFRLEGIGGTDTAQASGLPIILGSMVPFLGNLFIYGRTWEKVVSVFSLPLILYCMVITKTRAGLLGMVAIAIMFFILADRKYRLKIAPLMVILSLVLVVYMPTGYLDRMKTITDYQEDASATSRIEYWKAGLRMMLEHPLGVGQRNFLLLSMDYVPGLSKPRASHNIFVQIGSETGVLGLIVFCLLISYTFRDLYKIHKGTPSIDAFDRRVKVYSNSLLIGLAGILVQSCFMDRAYFEPIYWFIGFTVVLKRMVQEDSLSSKQESQALCPAQGIRESQTIGKPESVGQGWQPACK